MVLTSRDEAFGRVWRRHLAAGIEATEGAAKARASGNDMVNFDGIAATMSRCDGRAVIRNGDSLQLQASAAESLLSERNGRD